MQYNLAILLGISLTLLSVVGYSEVHAQQMPVASYHPSLQNDPGPITMNHQAAPHSPRNFTGMIENEAVYLTWEPPTEVGSAQLTGYTIVYRIGNTNPFTVATSSVPADATSHTVRDLNNGMTYQFAIFARNITGMGSWSHIINVTPYAVAGVTPNLTAQGGQNQVMLKWDRASDEDVRAITNYVVSYRVANSGDDYERIFTTIFSSDPDRFATITDPDKLENGVSYEFIVQALNYSGLGRPSESVTVTVGTLPGAPLNLERTSSNTKISLDWDAPADPAYPPITGYVIMVQIGSTAPYELARVSANQTSYEHHMPTFPIQINHQYTHTIYAENAVGQGMGSSIDTTFCNRCS